MSDSRTLKITGHNLGIDVTLMLTFTPPNFGKLYVDEFPLCWRIIEFPKTGHVAADVIYTPNTAFLSPQIQSGNIIVASDWQECAIGDKCNLQEDKGFSQPITGDPGFLGCTNKSSTPAIIGIGLYEGEEITPSVIWTDVSVNNILKVGLTSRLLIYSTSEYDQSQIITGEVQAPKVWDHEMMSLANVTNLTVSVNPNTHEVSLMPQ